MQVALEPFGGVAAKFPVERRASRRGVRIGAIFAIFNPPLRNPRILAWRFPPKVEFPKLMFRFICFDLIFGLKSARPTYRLTSNDFRVKA